MVQNPRKISANIALGNALEMFVWILNHVSRSITWSLLTLKASNVVKWLILPWFFMCWCQFIDWLILNLAAVPCATPNWLSKRTYKEMNKYGYCKTHQSNTWKTVTKNFSVYSSTTAHSMFIFLKNKFRAPLERYLSIAPVVLQSWETFFGYLPQSHTPEVEQ